MSIYKRDQIWKQGQTINVLFYGGTSYERQQVKDAFKAWTPNLNIVYSNKSRITDIGVAFREGKTLLGSAASLVNGKPTLYIPDAGVFVSVLRQVGRALGLEYEHHNKFGVEWNEEIVLSAREFLGFSRSDTNYEIFRTVSEDEFQFSKFDSYSVMLKTFPVSWIKNHSADQVNYRPSKQDYSAIEEMYGKRQKKRNYTWIVAAFLISLGVMVTQCVSARDGVMATQFASARDIDQCDVLLDEIGLCCIYEKNIRTEIILIKDKQTGEIQRDRTLTPAQEQIACEYLKGMKRT